MDSNHERILRHFEYKHLPTPRLRKVSHKFYALAYEVARLGHTDPAEASVALRKLLEAKDAAVRSVL